MEKNNEVQQARIRETVTYGNGVTITFPIKHHIARMGETIYIGNGEYFADDEVAEVTRLESGVAVILRDGRDVGLDFDNESNAFHTYEDLLHALGVAHKKRAVSSGKIRFAKKSDN